MPAVLRALVFAATFLAALLDDPSWAVAAALAPDELPLAVTGPAGGVPTTLASADLDADGMPDLIVAYAKAGTTTLVVYPGDVGAVYPTPGAPRTFMATPFLAPYELVTIEGKVACVTPVDVDTDGLKDLVVERTLGGAVLLPGFGDGSIAPAEPLATDVVTTAKARPPRSRRAISRPSRRERWTSSPTYSA